jgi:hypothetical protein
MTTNIPPHNIKEVIAALNQLIDNPLMDVNQLMEYIPEAKSKRFAILKTRSILFRKWKH